MELIQPKQQQQQKMEKSKESLRDLRDNSKHADTHVTGIPEGEDNENGAEHLFDKIMTKNIPNLQAQRVLKDTNPERLTLRHIIINVSKVKDEETLLKAAKGKRLVTSKETPIRP